MTWLCRFCGRANIWWRDRCKDCNYTDDEVRR